MPLWKSTGCGQKTPGRLGSLQATPTVKHAGENGSKRVGTESFWVTITMTYVVTGTITPFFVCMLFPFPFGSGRRRVVPCGDLRGDIRD